MPKLISVHSFRGGTGKSNTTANLAALMAASGRRVAVVDTDIQSPGIHVLFGVNESDLKYALNDYLWGNCEISQAALDVTDKLGAKVSGQLFLVPSSLKAGDIARILREGYDVDLLKDGYRSLIAKLKLDVLLIDTHPGLNQETLTSIALSNALVILLRPDQQDYLGTAVTVQVARKLGVPQMLLLVNRVPTSLDLASVQARVEKAFNCQVGAVLPHSDDMMLLGSEGLFAVRQPDHAWTVGLKRLIDQLL